MASAEGTPAAQRPAPARRLGRILRRVGPDLAIVIWLAWIYDAVNNLPAVRQGIAYRHGQGLLSFEHALHLDPEHALNLWLVRHRALAHVVVFYYNEVHGLVAFALIGWLCWRRPTLMPELRTALILINVIALVVFWTYPVAPPRMLVSHGYVDLTASIQGLPVWAGGAVAAHANQLQSLPSLHIAWAVWVTVAIWRVTRRRLVRAAAVVYPLITTFAVMATANHFLVDAVTGALLTAVAVPTADRLLARARR